MFMLVMTLGVSIVFLGNLASYCANGLIPPEVTEHAKDWPLPNRDYSNTRFTADATINSGNVGKLGLAWSFKIPGIGAFGGAASNPIIMGNNVFISSYLPDNCKSDCLFFFYNWLCGIHRCSQCARRIDSAGSHPAC